MLESWYPPDTAAAVARQAGAKLVVVTALTRALSEAA